MRWLALDMNLQGIEADPELLFSQLVDDRGQVDSLRVIDEDSRMIDPECPRCLVIDN